jgi:hypothetical protein
VSLAGSGSRGCASPEVALPSRSSFELEGESMGRIVIGVDPHKASNTLVVIDERERVLA